MRWRDRVADRLSGGRITRDAADLVDARRAAVHARAAARATQTQLVRVLRTDPELAAHHRAVGLFGEVLARFDGSGAIATARVPQTELTEWWSKYDELSRVPDDDLVADREPEQPAIVHPATDNHAADERHPDVPHDPDHEHEVATDV